MPKKRRESTSWRNDGMLNKTKSFIPKRWLNGYHFLLAHLAAFVYRHPSSAMRVIGVTGTNGKSSTVQLIGQLLAGLGKKIGWTTTASFRIGDIERENNEKMTMLGRFATQKLLREMKKAGCEYAIIETSSQGVEQSRHRGIRYDTLVFTNLTPEHIEAHGGFEKYKLAKLSLFACFETLSDKIINGVRVPKTIVVNLDDEHAGDFAMHNSDRTLGFTCMPNHEPVSVDEEIRAADIVYELNGTTAKINGRAFESPLTGAYYFKNTLAAISAVVSLGFTLERILPVAKTLKPIAGRLETFKWRGATIIVDYAYEPYALRALYEAAALFNPKRIIHVTGSAGGGRDVSRRAEIGRLAAERDDVIVVTNEDPYDDDPIQIINDVAAGATENGMVDGENLFRISDREKAIHFAIKRAESGDIVLITGKGSETVMAVANGKKIPCDDRATVRGIIGA